MTLMITGDRAISTEDFSWGSQQRSLQWPFYDHKYNNKVKFTPVA